MTLSYSKSAPGLGSKSIVIAMSLLVFTRNFRFAFPVGRQCTFKGIRIQLLCVFRGIWGLGLSAPGRFSPPVSSRQVPKICGPSREGAILKRDLSRPVLRDGQDGGG